MGAGQGVLDAAAVKAAKRGVETLNQGPSARHSDEDVETSVVVDIVRGGVVAGDDEWDEEGRYAISVVTLTELRLGVNKRYDSETTARADAIEKLDRQAMRGELRRPRTT